MQNELPEDTAGSNDGSNSEEHDMLTCSCKHHVSHLKLLKITPDYGFIDDSNRFDAIQSMEYH